MGNQQWNICADKGLFRPLCDRCDIELNAIVLRWALDPNAEAKLAAYKP